MQQFKNFRCLIRSRLKGVESPNITQEIRTVLLTCTHLVHHSIHFVHCIPVRIPLQKTEFMKNAAVKTLHFTYGIRNRVRSSPQNRSLYRYLYKCNVHSCRSELSKNPHNRFQSNVDRMLCRKSTSIQRELQEWQKAPRSNSSPL